MPEEAGSEDRNTAALPGPSSLRETRWAGSAVAAIGTCVSGANCTGRGFGCVRECQSVASERTRSVDGTAANSPAGSLR